jgi:hypothetical protein
MKQTEIELILRAEKTIDQLNEVKAAIENNIIESEKLRETNEKGFKGLKGTLKNAQTGIKNLAKGFSGAGLAAKGFVLALGAKIFDTFLDIAKQNQVVVDALGVAFGTVSSVVNQVVNGLTDAYKSVQDATGGFNALGDVLKNVILIPLNIVKTQFFALQKGLLTAQAAWEMSFLGGKDPEKIAELNTKLEEVDANLKNAAGSLVDNVKNIGQGFGQAIEEVKTFGSAAIDNIKEIDVAQTLSNQQRIQDLRNEAQIAIAENDKLQFQFQLAAERQRQIRDDVTASIEDRTKANNKLGEVLQEQAQLQEANALKNLELAQLEAKEFPNSIERKVALIEAEKNLADIRENIAGFESEQRVNAEALELEAIELVNTKKEAENARLIAKKQFNAEEIDDELLKLEALRSIAQQEKELEETRLQEQIDRLGVGTQARQDAEQQLLDFRQEKDLQIAELDNQITDQEDKNRKQTLAEEELLQKQKLALAGDALGAVSQLLGENSKAGKAAAIAQAIINSYLGFTEVLKTPTTLLEPFGSIQKAVSAAGILASGLKTVKQIASTQIPVVGVLQPGQGVHPHHKHPHSMLLAHHRKINLHKHWVTNKNNRSRHMSFRTKLQMPKQWIARLSRVHQLDNKIDKKIL